MALVNPDVSGVLFRLLPMGVLDIEPWLIL